MKKLLALVLAIAMTLSFTAALAENTLTMATNASFPPYEYYDGETVVGIDVEICAAIAAKLGATILDDPTLGFQQGYMYNMTYDEGYVKSPGFAGIKAPTTADHRYFDEDANGLCLWEDMGKALGLPTKAITSVINMCDIVRAKDYRAVMTKSIKSLGLDKYELTRLSEFL